MAPTPDIIDTTGHAEQEHIDAGHFEEGYLEQARREDKEEHLRLEAELQSQELRKQQMQSEMSGYDSRFRHDARFPDSAAENSDVATQNDRLSLDGDEPPVR